jgi:hypothetical protein
MKRHSWAKCREPFKTELDTLGSQWIEGALTHEQLALELWQLWSRMRFVEAPSEGAVIDVADVQRQAEVLAEALCAAQLRPATSLQDRREILEHMCQIGGHDGSDIHR